MCKDWNHSKSFFCGMTFIFVDYQQASQLCKEDEIHKYEVDT